MGAMVPPSRKTVTLGNEVNRVVDEILLMSPLILGLIYTRKRIGARLIRRKIKEIWKRKHWNRCYKLDEGKIRRSNRWR